MAKKQNEQKSNAALSQAQGFTGGMITDPDPRFQVKGSYRDALNVRLSNENQSTFTVENILGNKKMFNLNEICQQDYDATNPTGILGTMVASLAGDNTTSQIKFSEIYSDPTTTTGTGQEVGEYYPSINNAPLPSPSFSGLIPFNGTSNQGGWSVYKKFDASIVGHYSYNHNVIFIIVIPHFSEVGRTQTIFLDVLFNKDLNVEKIYDLLICYNHETSPKYPDLNMKMNMPLRVEGIIENECISRLFWTDNENSLRSINLGQSGKNRLSPDVLDLTPLHSPSQAVVTKTISGSLPVGQLQYCYKYISSNGGETVMSPFSNLYHTTKQGFQVFESYHGSISGDPFVDVSSHGFEVTIKDLDVDFDIVELYSILHVQNDGPVRVSLVGSKQYGSNASEVIFYHNNWDGDLLEGIDSVLIDINTWDVCKDITIKDNILFAGNIKTRDNTISESEWNVKVRRYNIADELNPGSITGTITSDDAQIKEYEIDNNGDTVSAPASLGKTWTNGMPKWRTYKGDGVSNAGGGSFNDNGRVDIVKKQSHEYRYLSDGLTLGGESYDYSENDLGGCRLTFDMKPKEVDSQNNVDTAPFISAGSIGDTPSQDLIDETDAISADSTGPISSNNSETIYKATMGLGGNKDPNTGNFKGYRRGEMYRFGVQIYDKNGRPGNVLWIGDIEMPEMNDPLRRLEIFKSGYNPGLPTYINQTGASSLYDLNLLSTDRLSTDHRTSAISGLSVPNTDVSWFNQTVGGSVSIPRKTRRYYFASGANMNEYTHLPSGYGGVGLSLGTIDATTTVNNGAGLELLTAFTNYSGTHNSGGQAGFGGQWYSPKKVLQMTQFKHDYFTAKQIPNNVIGNAHNGVHYAFDLYVNFEFRIPENIREKMSGFRVVRAERQESDKSILQQGILNQTVAYGNQNIIKGYFASQQINQQDAHKDDKGTYSTSTGFANHFKYDELLNGYIGLAENSNLAFQSDNAISPAPSFLPSDPITNNIMGPLGGADYNAQEWIYAHNEFEEASTSFNGNMFYHNNPVIYNGTNQVNTPHNNAPKTRHSAYFGSYEVMPNVRDAVNPLYKVDLENVTDEYKHWSKGAVAQAVQGSVFTLDCPDSAFGTTAYTFRSSDTIRVDSVMKLVYDYKTTYTSNSAGNGANVAFGARNACGNNYASGASSQSNSLPLGGVERHAVQPASNANPGRTWKPKDNTKTDVDALRYCRKKYIGDGKDKMGALIAKYYIYDTYWGIGMSVDGGATYAEGSHDNTTIHHDAATQYMPAGAVNTNYKPSQHHDIYYHTILNAQELEQGERLSKSFFKQGVLMLDVGDAAFGKATVSTAPTNKMSGFSNNTLGYYIGRRVHSTAGTDYHTGGTSFLYGRMEAAQPHNTAATTNGSNDGARTYDTISTIQKGLRTILIQIDGDGLHGEKRGLLNPRDLSGILEHKNWGAGPNGTYYHAFQSHISNKVAGATRGDKHNQTTSTYGPETASGDFGGASYIPYKFLCTIVRKTIPYGGPGLNAINSTRYIPAGNFHQIKKDANGDSKPNHLSKVFGGDTFVNFYSHQKTACPYEKRSFARWQVFPVESDTNTDMRLGYHLGAGDTNIGDTTLANITNTNDWEYNDVYSQENNLKSAISVDEDKSCKSLDLPYQIVYSETKISGEPEDSFKVFKQFSFHDMESQYGEITRLASWRNDIYVLQESSMSKLLVNPISLVADELGSSLFTGTGETVENHLYISTKFGTRHMESVVTTEQAIYYIDNNYGKLVQYTGESLTSLSDDLGQRNALRDIIKGTGNLDSKKKVGRNFICDNSLKFNGITSVFDYKNNELIITMHSSILDEEGNRVINPILESSITVGYQPETNSKTLVYSESLNAFTSYYSVTPKRWMTIGGLITTTESMTYFNDNTNDFNNNELSVWKWDDQINNYKNMFFNETISPTSEEIGLSSITKSISELPSVSKVFDNAKIIMTPNPKSNLTNQFVSFNTELTGPDLMNINNNTAAKYQEGILKFPLRDTNKPGPRQRGTYINITYSTRSINKFNIFAILAKYRKSYQ